MVAFNEDIIALIPQLRRYATALAGRRAAADDLVQDCLERALSRRRLFRADTNLRAWLFTIMHNINVNELRRAAARPRTDPIGEGGAGPRFEADQENHLELSDLARALDRLSAEQREMVVLIGLEQLSYEEAAAVAGVPVGTVMSRLHRGRERLRTLMNGEDEGAHLTRVK